MFQKETYVGRRNALRAGMKGETGIAVFVGNVDSPAQYRDNCYKWRQDSNWLYFFGIDEPGFAAIMDLDAGTETVYADDYSLDDIIWTGPMESVSAQASRVGIDVTAPSGAFAAAVSAAVSAGRKVHFLPVSRMENAVLLASVIGCKPSELFSAGKKGCHLASEPLVRSVIKLRLVKTDEEIALLDAAAVLGQEMHTIARKGIRQGRIEQEIVGEMESVALAKGWGISFPTILTQHGEIFHCHSHSCPVEPGRLMVVDAGVESNEHYASDFTRTYPTSGKFTSKQRDIYRIVSDCHDLAFSMAGPGVRYFDVHQAVASLMLGRLSDLGIVKGDVAEMVSDGIAGLFMPHGLGHNMGLDVHDMEDLGEDFVGYDSDQKRSGQLGLGSLRMARTLVPGNVVTDEPGIYFIPALIGQWKRERRDGGRINYSLLESYYDFGGIRLEDDVLITADGARRLGGRRLPATVEEIEAAMAEDALNL